MRVAYNDSDDSAGLRGYVQFNKYTYIHTYIHTYCCGRGTFGCCLGLSVRSAGFPLRSHAWLLSGSVSAD